jgi:hypothetical protein
MILDIPNVDIRSDNGPLLADIGSESWKLCLVLSHPRSRVHQPSNTWALKLDLAFYSVTLESTRLQLFLVQSLTCHALLATPDL